MRSFTNLVRVIPDHLVRYPASLVGMVYYEHLMRQFKSAVQDEK